MDKVLELHIKVNSQEEVNRLVELTKPFKAEVYKIKEKFDDEKHFDLFSHWKLAGELSLATLRQNEHVLDAPGLYCITFKGNEQDKTPFFHKSIYIGESTVSMLNRLKMFEGDWRGIKTNHGGKIYEKMNRLKLSRNEFNIWYRRHRDDGDLEHVDSAYHSKIREAHALALHIALFNSNPLLNTRDTPSYHYTLTYRNMRETLLEKIR